MNPPNELLKAVYGKGFKDYYGWAETPCCLFCSAELDHSHKGKHEPNCLFFQIEAHLKEVGLIQDEAKPVC